MRGFLVCLSLLVCSAAHAGSSPPSFLYAKDGALWAAPAQGAARELGKLPAELGAPSSLAADGSGAAVLVGSAAGWYWASLTAASGLSAIDADEPSAPTLGAWRKLPCGAGRARLAPDGVRVLCASPTGTALILEPGTGAKASRNVSADHAAIVGAGADARLIWTDKQGIWSAPLGAPNAGGAPQRLAREAPRRGFSPSPSGARAMGTYEGRGHRGKAVVTQELLFSFALDGKAARRKLMADAKVVAWSADSAWALVQQGERACIVAANGGQTKCWKGFRAEAISADGRFALLAGDRGEEKADQKSVEKAGKRGDRASDGGPAPEPANAAPPAEASAPPPSERPALPGDEDSDATDEGMQEDGGEEGEDSELPHAASAKASHVHERHLYRAALEGAFTAAPTRVLSEFRGPAAFSRR